MNNRLFSLSQRTSGWAWKRFILAGVILVAVAGHFAKVGSQVSLPPQSYTSALATCVGLGGRLCGTTDSWGIFQDLGTGGTPNFYGPGNRKLTQPGDLTGQATTLNNGGTLNAGDTSMTVTSDAGFPAVPYIVQIQSEYIRVSAKTGTNWSTIVRAYGNVVGETAAAASHTDGSTVTLVNWMPVNIGTSGLSAAYGGINIVPQAGVGQFRAVVKIQPSTPYTITARFKWLGFLDQIGACAVGWREESTGKVVWIGAVSSTNTYFVFDKLSKLSNGTAADYAVAQFLQSRQADQEFQLHNDGANLSVNLTADGSNWSLFDASHTVNDYFTTAPDQIWFGCKMNSASGGVGNALVTGTLYSLEAQ